MKKINYKTIGEFVKTNQRVEEFITGSITGNKWTRIVEVDGVSFSSSGILTIVSDYNIDFPGSAVIALTFGYNNVNAFLLSKSASIFTKIRFVFRAQSGRCFIEIFTPRVGPNTVRFQLSNSVNYKFMNPFIDGSVHTDYTATEFNL